MNILELLQRVAGLASRLEDDEVHLPVKMNGQMVDVHFALRISAKGKWIEMDISEYETEDT